MLGLQVCTTMPAFILFCCSAGDWTQGLVHATQAFCYSSSARAWLYLRIVSVSSIGDYELIRRALTGGTSCSMHVHSWKPAWGHVCMGADSFSWNLETSPESLASLNQITCLVMYQCYQTFPNQLQCDRPGNPDRPLTSLKQMPMRICIRGIWVQPETLFPQTRGSC